MARSIVTQYRGAGLPGKLLLCSRRLSFIRGSSDAGSGAVSRALDAAVGYYKAPLRATSGSRLLGRRFKVRRWLGSLCLSAQGAGPDLRESFFKEWL